MEPKILPKYWHNNIDGNKEIGKRPNHSTNEVKEWQELAKGRLLQMGVKD